MRRPSDHLRPRRCTPLEAILISAAQFHPDRSAVIAAEERIRDHVRRTPAITLPGAFGLAGVLRLKLEYLQHSGSFKARGAFNAMLSQPLPDAGVIAASGGNHGAAVAYAAARLGTRAEIFVPASAPAVKVARLRAYGADVMQGGASYADALAASEARAAETGAARIHAYDDPAVVAGQGTAFAELAPPGAEPDTVIVAVGGGGLVGGAMAWLGGRSRIIAVEPDRAPTLHSARAAGGPVDVEVGGIAADSLGARRIGGISFSLAARYLTDAVLVPDTAILAAQRRLWDELRVIAEPGGATALAALLCGAYTPVPGETVALLICGANTDPGGLSA